MTENSFMLATFGFGGWEIVLILAVALVLFGAEKLPELSRGLGRGLFEFRKSTREVAEAIDEEAEDAGRSLGGIYGKPAAQALTPDNQVAELYEPVVLEGERKPGKRWTAPEGLFKRMWAWVRRLWHAGSSK